MGETDTNTCDSLNQAVRGIYTRRRLAIALAMSAVFFALLVNDSWRITPDSGLYMCLGRSLAEGQGFTYNGEPHRMVPPGYPALLAALDLTCGENFLSLRIAHAAMGWLCGLLVFLALRRLCGNDLAFVVFLLFFLAQSLFARSAYFLSDVPFALVTWLALLAAAYALTVARHHWLWAILAGLTLSLGPLVRINGWGLLPAILLGLLVVWGWRRAGTWGRVALVAVLAAALPLAWHFWLQPATTVAAGGTYLAAVTNKVNVLHSYFHCMLRYPDALGEALIGFATGKAVGLILLIPVALGGIVCLRRRTLAVLPLVVALQFAGLFLSTPGERYLIPILPLLYLFALLGLVALVEWLRRTRGWLADVRLARLVAGVCVVLIAVQVGRDVKCVWQARAAVPGGAETRDKQYWFEACRWYNEHAATAGAAERPAIISEQVGLVNYLTRARVVWPLAPDVLRPEHWRPDGLPPVGPPDHPPEYLMVHPDNQGWLPVHEALATWHAQLQAVRAERPTALLTIYRITWPTDATAPAATRR